MDTLISFVQNIADAIIFYLHVSVTSKSYLRNTVIAYMIVVHLDRNYVKHIACITVFYYRVCFVHVRVH